MVGERPQMVDGLHWLRGELELALGRVRAALEQHLENPQDAQLLAGATEELHQVRGTLGMIQCHGAALLAEEMLQLLRELASRPPADEAYTALSGASLQLSDYLDLLTQGEADRAVLLQPVINELRLARGKPLLTEAELFAAQVRALRAPAPAEALPPSGATEAAQSIARRELTAFQSAFLQWFRGAAAEAGMTRMGEIADRLAVNAGAPRLREMWAGYATLAECLRAAPQTDSLDLKRLFGRAGSQLKRLAEAGEASATAEVGDVPELLLFYIVRAPRHGTRARAIIEERNLAALLPPPDELDALRHRLRAPNTSILARVSEEIRRDFARVKDHIDLAVRTGGRAAIDLAATRANLQRLANTLGALGLPAPQQALLNQAQVLEQTPAEAAAWMEIATRILRVEHSLEEALFRTLGRKRADDARSYAELAAQTPPGRDLRESVKAGLREALVDFARLKAAVDDFLKRGDPTALEEAPGLTGRVAAVLLVLDRPRASQLLRRLEHYLKLGVLTRPQTPRVEFERFADAVSCLELYLEALRDELPMAPRRLAEFEQYLARLDFSPAPAAGPGAAPAPVSAPDVPKPVSAAPAPGPSPAPVVAAAQGVDPEIREIFAEEAGEVLAELQRLWPALKRDPGERTALAEIRRAFHTLKGSGRMAGALRIGEFGQAVEALLNRCLESGAPPRAPVLQAVEQAVGLLPGLIANFRGEGGEDPAVAALIERAQALAAPGRAGEPDMLAVFREDARERLGFVRRWLEAQNLGEADFAVEPEVVRAFHTLRGSAAVVHAEGLRRLAEAMEDYLNGLRLSGARLTPPALSLIADALVALHGWLDSPAVTEAGKNEVESWRSRIAGLRSAAVAAAPRPVVDEAFALHALELLQAQEGRARAWSRNETETGVDPATALAAGFSELALAAGRANCEPLAASAALLAERLDAWRDHAAPDAAFFAALFERIEGLYRQLDAYREAAPVPAAEAPELPSPPSLPPQEAATQTPPPEIEAFEAFPEPAAKPDQVETQAPVSAAEPEVFAPSPPPALRSAATEQAPAAPQPAPARRLDEELIDVFAAEAAELLEQLERNFEAWRGGEEGEALRELQRALHTLKGGARMAGLEAMGDLTHELESEVNRAAATGEFPDATAFAQMRGALERLQTMHDQIRRGQAELLAAPLAPLPEAQPAPAPPAPLAGGWAPELFWRPEEETAGFAAARRETARVPVEALDAMLNQAGEISIYRSRLEERNASLRAQLLEVTQTIARIREQLRQLDIETEAQIAARGLTPGGTQADRYAQDFDPLEMDRYSRMQELSRALAESVGDLAALQATMSDAVAETDTLLLQQSRVTSEVQQGLMGALMVPFSREAQRLIRVVRQTAQECGKQAEVQFAGIEAELDRNVLERVLAPLEHLLRNAVVHGIEDPAERAMSGKPVVGQVHVRLARESAQVLVEVADDGRGLDFAAIRAKAVERGLMRPEAQLSDDELARFIFEPGFSTARSLTQHAGRGIGMDVVAAEVKQLGGTLELRSETGKGTRFLLRLPLTLAVSQALLVGVGAEVYALPLPSIEGIGRIPRAELHDYYREDGPLYAYGGRGYRVRHLGAYVGLPYAHDPQARTVTAILVRLGEGLGAGERRVALVVDELLGNREIVSKAIGPQIAAVPGVSGATILADGRVVLILDVPTLVSERARRAALAQAAGRATAPAPAQAPAQTTVMVVDDSITMRRVAERLLARHGYRVVTAKDGLDAMALLQTETPQVVLLDIEMPRADGFEVAAFMRNTPRLKDVPIVVITSRSGEKHRSRAQSLGVARYLIKPYQEEQLLAEIRAVQAVH
ncbi:MAG: Hpt domain-containing protein [Nevskia sp.]|nr:Hpt domain-containing protein [Nevskia sp.]